MITIAKNNHNGNSRPFGQTIRVLLWAAAFCCLCSCAASAHMTYRNGYILDKKGEVVGNYANGYIFDTARNIKGYYANGYIYDENHRITGYYSNGFIQPEK